MRKALVSRIGMFCMIVLNPMDVTMHSDGTVTYSQLAVARFAASQAVDVGKSISPNAGCVNRACGGGQINTVCLNPGC
jgi:hypothetical protein